MKYPTTIASAALLLAGALPASATTFNFYETSIDTCNSNACHLPPQPYVLMTLNVSEDQGSATNLAETDPAFSLVGYGTGGLAVADPVACVPGGSSTYPLCTTWSVSWDLSDNGMALDSVSIAYEAWNSNLTIHFGLTGGSIAVDGDFGGCGMTQCRVSGYWLDPPIAAPEPASWPFLLFGVAAMVYRRSRIAG